MDIVEEATLSRESSSSKGVPTDIVFTGSLDGATKTATFAVKKLNLANCCAGLQRLLPASASEFNSKNVIDTE